MTAATEPSTSQAISAPSPRGGAYLLIAICFLLSGFAALLYETVWLRQFAIILGTSEQALAVILASYMGGLSAGAWVAARTVDRVTHPVWLYGVLEAGIALCAIAMPWGLGAVAMLQVRLFGGASEPPAAGGLVQVGFGLASTLALILLPTAMMGATLPLLAKHVVHRNRQVGPRIGLLYGINTFGAVAGTLAAAFVFLPTLGLRRTTWVGAVVNFAIFALILFLARRGQGADHRPGQAGRAAVSDPASDEDETAASSSDQQRYRLVLWFAAAAGAVAFCYEIVFTRMLSHILGGSIYAFATMLAGFLLGIAIGGMLASRLAVRRDRSVVALVYAQSSAGLCALLAYHLIDHVAGWSLADLGGPSAIFAQVSVSILILLPTSIFIGATFPLATRIYARDQSEAAAGSGRVYFWNTVGGILGALATGMFLLPALAYEGSTWIAVSVNAILALGLVWVMRASSLHLIAGAATLVVLACFAPAVPERVMRVSALDGRPIEGDLIFNHVGKSGTVALFDQQGDTRFTTNGLPEAVVAQKGSQDPYASSGAWLSALPPVLRAGCDSMLIVGLGGGVAAAHVPPSVSEIDVFELEPAVVDANDFIRERRNQNPLADPRVKIILNDGRNGLALTNKRYDAIVSQPSHPWTAGASHLYTRQFAETARQRLSPGGIFLQWMNTSFVNPPLYRSLAATLLDVFPHVRVYEPFPENVLFVASDDPIGPEAIGQPKLAIHPRDTAYYARMGLQTPTHLLSILRIDEPELRLLAKHAPLVTDEYNLLAMQAPFLLSSGDREAMKQFLTPFVVTSQSARRIREICPGVNVNAWGLRVAMRNINLDIETVRELVDNEADTLFYRALMAKKEGQRERWGQLLRESIRSGQSGEADADLLCRAAFLLLAHSALGTGPAVDADETGQLEQRLDDRYARFLAAIRAASQNDFVSVRQSEATLASLGIDETGYDLAIRLQIVWRITDQGPDGVRHGLEALDLIAEAAPSLGLNALVPFRVAAALRADRQDVALASVVGYAKAVVQQIKEQTVTDKAQMQLMRSNLIKCYQMIQDQSQFLRIPTPRYRGAVEYLKRVIAGDV